MRKQRPIGSGSINPALQTPPLMLRRTEPQQPPIAKPKPISAQAWLNRHGSTPIEWTGPGDRRVEFVEGLTPLKQAVLSHTIDRLHAHGQGLNPRSQLLAAVNSQSAHPPTYRSKIGEQLLRQRHPHRTITPLGEMPTPQSGAYATLPSHGKPSGPAFATVPPTLDRAPEELRDFYRTSGYGVLANHELEHAWQGEEGWAHGTPAMRDAITTPIEDQSSWWRPQDKNARMAQSRQADLRQAMGDQYRSRATSLPGSESTLLELGPTIGDMVFRAEQFNQEHGHSPGRMPTPDERTEIDQAAKEAALAGRSPREALIGDAQDPRLQHTVRFPHGKAHDINWMIEQARKHGYFGDRGNPRAMDDLIFDTPAGQQWLRHLLRPRTPERQMSEPRPPDLTVEEFM